MQRIHPLRSRTERGARRILPTVLLLTFSMIEAAGAQALSNQPLIDRLKQRIHLSALSEVQYGLGTDGNTNQMLEFIVKPEVEIDLPFDLQLTAIGRIRADVFDEIEPGIPSQDTIGPATRRGFIGDQVDFELRELYVDGKLGRSQFRVGKQQIVWGQADGLKVLDVVNPQSFREFILDDFDDSRIPLWSVNLEIPFKNVVAQLIWIPDQTYHELAETDALFTLTSPMLIPEPPPGIIPITRSPDRPDHVFKDSDAGVRLSTFWRGWDLTLNYLYQYSNAPIFFRTITPPRLPRLPPGAPPICCTRFRIPPPTVTVEPGFERTHLIGGSFSNAFGDFTVRGEAAYATDRYVSTTDPMDTDGVVRMGEFSYVAGLDWAGIENTLVSAQLFQTYLTKDDSSLIRDSVDTNATLLLRREFLNDSLVGELMLIQSVDHGDGIFRSKIGYELRDDLIVSAGFDFFYGISDGVFGQFDRNDRVLFGLEWGL